MRVLGIDPGLGGALAMLDTELPGALAIADIPTVLVSHGRGRRREINEAMLASLLRRYEPDVAWLERVHSLPKQGVSSTFSFGVTYGVIRGVLAALSVPVNLVTPQEWKKHHRIGKEKAFARAAAVRLFPSHAERFDRVKDDGRAEAALLALYGVARHSEA